MRGHADVQRGQDSRQAGGNRSFHRHPVHVGTAEALRGQACNELDPDQRGRRVRGRAAGRARRASAQTGRKVDETANGLGGRQRRGGGERLCQEADGGRACTRRAGSDHG